MADNVYDCHPIPLTVPPETRMIILDNEIIGFDYRENTVDRKRINPTIKNQGYNNESKEDSPGQRDSKATSYRLAGVGYIIDNSGE